MTSKRPKTGRLKRCTCNACGNEFESYAYYKDKIISCPKCGDKARMYNIQEDPYNLPI